MKRVTIWLVLLAALCSVCWSATVQLRNGKKLSGDVVAKDDDQVVLKTPAGVVTQAWRSCTPATIKALHPALYQRLVKEAQERKKQQEEEMAAKGLVNVGGKWIDKDEAIALKMAKVRLSVDASELGEPYEKTDQTRYEKYYERNCRGVLIIKLDGLNITSEHSVKVVYTHYIRTTGTSTPGSSKTDDGVTKTARVVKEGAKELRYESQPYRQRKWKARYSLGYSGNMATSQSDGWDVSIWLDGVLIYEAKKDGKPEYHHVQKW